MTDKDIKSINIAKYVEALNNLIGVDSAYFKGDKDVDAIVEIITLAKKFEGVINRQKADIERLQERRKPTETSGFKIENGKVVFYTNMLNGYRHEYKDIEEIVKELNLYMHTDYKNIELISYYQHKAQTAKTETIKEFANLLKHQFDRDLCHSGSNIVKRIDNLVKEMTEGK